MRSKLALAAAIFTAASLLVATAFASNHTERVRFKAGASSAAIKGSVTGYNTSNYLLGARAGQVVSVLFSANNNSCYFNFIEPGTDSAIHMGEVAGNEYSGNLQKSGDYRVEVYLMRNEARRGKTRRYSITFEISGGSQSGSSSSDSSGVPSQDEQACLQAVSQQTQNGDVVLLSAESSEANNTLMVGVGPDRAPWRCLVKSGKVAEVMSMTNEGAQ